VTDEKTNEVTAVPELLDSLNIEGSIVTADAMSCQREIVQKIRKGKGGLCDWLEKQSTDASGRYLAVFSEVLKEKCLVLQQLRRIMEG